MNFNMFSEETEVISTVKEMRYVFLEIKTNLKIIYVTEVHVYDTWNVHVISVTNTPNNVKRSSNLIMIKTSTVLKKRKYTTFRIQFRSVLQCQTAGNC